MKQPVVIRNQFVSHALEPAECGWATFECAYTTAIVLAGNKCPPALSSRIMNVKTRVLVFVLVTFAFTCACQAPALIAWQAGAEPPGLLLAMMAVGSCGPSLVAVWFRLLEGRARAVAQTTGAPISQRALWKLSSIALVLPAACHLFGSLVLYVLGLYDAQHLVYLPLLPAQIAIAIIAPLGEEYGWRGYALPRLQAVMSPLAASFWIGLAWALWHIPTFFVPGARGTSALELCLYLLAFLASSVIYTWLFNAGAGSMRGPLLAHLGIHLDNVFRASALGDGVMPLASTSLVLALLAALLILRGSLDTSRSRYHLRPASGSKVALVNASEPPETTT